MGLGALFGLLVPEIQAPERIKASWLRFMKKSETGHSFRALVVVVIHTQASKRAFG